MKFCPKCGSENLNYEPWLGEIYECRNCGYRGVLVIEDDDPEIADAIKKEFETGDKEE
jgi:DNA-directed RNA polymerase subunit M/transcription elongation factor TFIIS